MKRIFFAALALFLLFVGREPFSGQARLHLLSARALSAHGNLDIANEGALPSTVVYHGRRFAIAPLGPTLLLAPVELAGLLLPHSERGARLQGFLEAATSAAGAALLCALFFGVVVRLGARRSTALLATGALAAATTIAVYARIPDGSVWAALLLLVGVAQARRFTQAPSLSSAVWLGVCAGGLVLFDLTPAALVLLVFAVVFAADRSLLAWALLPLGAAVALALVHQKWIGAPPRISGDLLQGLDGLLLSTGKSLFAYSPPLALLLFALPGWWRARRADAVLVLAIAVAVILPAAGLERWHGDPAWGPRRLVPLVPLLLAPIAPFLDEVWPRLRTPARAAVVGLLGTGVLVQILGAAFPAETYLHIAAVVKNGSGANGWFAASDQAHFMPQFSPLVGHAWLLSHVIRRDPKLEIAPPWSLLVPVTPKLEAEWPRVRLDWWALSFSRDTVAK